MKTEVFEVSEAPIKPFAKIGKFFKAVASAADTPLGAFLLVIAGGAYIPFALWLANTYQFNYLLYPVLFAVMYVGCTSGRKNRRAR